ncbi:hypothetical protein LSAT2_000828 [Lamellibrachia satsuma]|nr:hypothetical protein LSAT2_000828 [Lamellibrachia satsuma]
MYMATMPPMQGASFLDSPTVVNHEYEEEQMFSGVLEKVIAELRVIMMKDLSKKMVETSAFKSFEGWWDGEKNRQKSQKVIPNATEKVTVAKATTAPMTKMSDLDSISTLFDNQSKGLARAFGVGGLLGLRGAVPKLPSFRRKFRPPSPPLPDEKFRGPRTPDGSDNDDVSDVESLPAKGKTKKALLDDTDKSDSDSDDEEDEEDSSSGISEEEEEDSEEESSADEEEADEDEDVEMQSDKDDSEPEEDSASHKLQEQDKHKLENGDVTTTNEDVMSEDSRSRLSPILEVEDRKDIEEDVTREDDINRSGVGEVT